MHWTLWQLADSAFPAGGFAHSGGLEAASQFGEVRDDATLLQFVRDSLGQAGRAALPLVNAAHTDAGRLPELDALCDVFLSNAVANRASRVQGRAFLSACARTWRSRQLDDLADRRANLCGHFAPIFGASMTALGVAAPDAQRLFLHLTARGVLSAAVRLNIVGPYRAQQMQVACADDVERILAGCRELTEKDLSQTAPLIDLLQGAHDRLYSRLFQS
jgi:urease accessory protein